MTLAEVTFALVTLKTLRSSQQENWETLVHVLSTLEDSEIGAVPIFGFYSRWAEAISWLDVLIFTLSKLEQDLLVTQEKGHSA